MSEKGDLEDTTPTLSELENRPHGLARRILALNIDEISKASGVPSDLVEQRRARLVTKVAEAVTYIESATGTSKWGGRRMVAYDNGYTQTHKIDSAIVSLVAKSVAGNFDPRLERIQKGVDGLIDSVQQSIVTGDEECVDKAGDQWTPAIVYFRGFTESAIGNDRSKPGAVVRGLGFVTVRR